MRKAVHYLLNEFVAFSGAFADLIEKHKNAKPRSHVMGAYLASHEKYGPLYTKIAR